MNKKLITLFLCLTCITTHVTSQAVVATVPGSVTFDPSGWLSALDQVYATYDMVTNTITQIENQYKQIKHAIDSAKSIDWKVVGNGDWDIRGEIRDATKKVDSLLTSTRKIRDTLNRPVINMNGYSYSLADMCGAGKDGKNFQTAVEDMGKELNGRFKEFCDGLAGQMTPKQRKAIYTKYGISPQNYVMVQQSIDLVHNSCGKALSQANEEAEKLIIEEKVATTNALIAGAYETLTAEGDPTQSGMMEANMLIAREIALSIADVQKAVNLASQMIASQQLLKEKIEQAQKEEEQKQNLIEQRKEQRVPTRFKSVE